MKPKSPTKIEELAEDIQKVYDVLNHESEFACVLIGTSYLSELLGSSIMTVLRKSNVTKNILKPDRGAIGGFKSRADFAYCLELINKSDYKDLSIIAEIRNTFAHRHLSIDFTDNEIKEACNNLQACNLRLDLKEINNDPHIENIPEQAIECKDIRFRFTLSVVMISQRLFATTYSNRLKNNNETK